MRRGLGMGPGDCSVCCAPPMRLPALAKLAALPLCLAALALTGCGTEGIRWPRATRTTRARSCSSSTARAATRSPPPAPGLGDQGQDAREQGRPELRPAQGDRGGRALRDQQRRLLLGSDAAEHRHGRGRAEDRGVHREVLGPGRAEPAPAEPSARSEGDPPRPGAGARRARAPPRRLRPAARRRARPRRAPARAAARRSRRCGRARTRPRRGSRAPRRPARTRAAAIAEMQEVSRAGQGAEPRS